MRNALLLLRVMVCFGASVCAVSLGAQERGIGSSVVDAASVLSKREVFDINKTIKAGVERRAIQVLVWPIASGGAEAVSAARGILGEAGERDVIILVIVGERGEYKSCTVLLHGVEGERVANNCFGVAEKSWEDGKRAEAVEKVTRELAGHIIKEEAIGEWDDGSEVGAARKQGLLWLIGGGVFLGLLFFGLIWGFRKDK